MDVGKAHAGAFVGAGEAGVGLGEGLEHVVELRRVEADAGIPDDQVGRRRAGQ